MSGRERSSGRVNRSSEQSSDTRLGSKGKIQFRSSKEYYSRSASIEMNAGDDFNKDASFTSNLLRKMSRKVHSASFEAQTLMNEESSIGSISDSLKRSSIVISNEDSRSALIATTNPGSNDTIKGSRSSVTVGNFSRCDSTLIVPSTEIEVVEGESINPSSNEKTSPHAPIGRTSQDMAKVPRERASIHKSRRASPRRLSIGVLPAIGKEYEFIYGTSDPTATVNPTPAFRSKHSDEIRESLIGVPIPPTSLKRRSSTGSRRSTRHSTLALVKIKSFPPTCRLWSINPFNPDQVNSILRSIVLPEVEGLKYDPVTCPQLAKNLVDEIRHRIRLQNFERYRILCRVQIGQKKKQGVFTAFSFLWDGERDNYACIVYENISVFVTATVFGIYQD